MNTQIWQHIQSGERYSVMINETGQIVGAAGPLHHSEIAEARSGDWDSDAGLVQDINANPNNYRGATAD